MVFKYSQEFYLERRKSKKIDHRGSSPSPALSLHSPLTDARRRVAASGTERGANKSRQPPTGHPAVLRRGLEPPRTPLGNTDSPGKSTLPSRKGKLLARQPKLAGVCISPRWACVCVCARARFFFMYLKKKLWWRCWLGSNLTLGVDILGLKKSSPLLIWFRAANASVSPGGSPAVGHPPGSRGQRRASPSRGWRPQRLGGRGVRPQRTRTAPLSNPARRPGTRVASLFCSKHSRPHA